MTAVDIAGLESNPSNIIRMLPAIQPEQPTNEQPAEEQPSTN